MGSLLSLRFSSDDAMASRQAGGGQHHPEQQQQQQQSQDESITQQPGSDPNTDEQGGTEEVAEQPPPPIEGCPIGLEYLSQLDQVVVQQQIELIEVLAGFGNRNRYLVLNSAGQQFFRAEEHSDVYSRRFIGSSRPFELTLVDNFGREALRLQREFGCDSCCFPFCLHKLEVTSQGQLLGTVEQTWSPITPAFDVKDASGYVVLTIKGPWRTGSTFGSDKDYVVLTPDEEQEVGVITRLFPGFFMGRLADIDNFSVTFPMELDVHTKATLLGAVFLIDFMYYEQFSRYRRYGPYGGYGYGYGFRPSGGYGWGPIGPHGPYGHST